MNNRPHRSALYMPASNLRAIAKARSLPCDIVILDLEDSVAPDLKLTAREQARAAVEEGGFGERAIVVRINGLDTIWGGDDLEVISKCRPDAILVPKLSTVEELAKVRGTADDIPLWAMIETIRSLTNLTSIAAAANLYNLTTFVAGTNDLLKELRFTSVPGRAPLLPLLTQIVVAARGAGLSVLDGVCNNINDEAVIEAECVQGRIWGFDGKTLIHPMQIATANRVFSPNEEDVLRAQKIVEAFRDPRNSEKGALRIDGEMVELLHVAEAQRTIEIVEMIEAANSRSQPQG